MKNHKLLVCLFISAGLAPLALQAQTNTFEGTGAGSSITSGTNDSGFGFQALASTAKGSNDTAVGASALTSNTRGLDNLALGYTALSQNTVGSYNVASGSHALEANTTGGENVAVGYEALASNTNGFDNVALGFEALSSNINGQQNTALGERSLVSNLTGNYNVASGVAALLFNTSGMANTANGNEALHENSSGSYNTSVGYSSLYRNTTGENNIALGYNAGSALTTGNNNIDLGNSGMARESNHIRIGQVGTQKHVYIAGINGATVANGVGVIIDPSGHLGTVTSSARYKDKIEPMAKASEALLALKPVTFRYKKELDPEGTPQFGLVAEEVAKVDPDLVARDSEGKPYTVRYEAVNAMLLNEFLKEHRKVEDQSREGEELKSALAKQQEQIKALIATVREQAAQIRKVGEQLAAEKPASRLVSSQP